VAQNAIGNTAITNPQNTRWPNPRNQILVILVLVLLLLLLFLGCRGRERERERDSSSSAFARNLAAGFRSFCQNLFSFATVAGSQHVYLWRYLQIVVIGISL
jgi:hypothetical protein